MPRKDTEFLNASPREKQYKMYDSDGLFMLVKPNGRKYWRWRYKWQGKEKLLSIGIYKPKDRKHISLKQARDLRYEASRQLDSGTDPSAAKKQLKTPDNDNAFETVAQEWFERHLSTKSTSHYKRCTQYLIRDVFPYIGTRPVNEIKPPEIISVIDRIHQRVKRDSHLRTLQTIGQVMRYAIATGRRSDPDPTPSLKGMFPAKEPKRHFAAMTDPLEIGQLLRTIETYPSFITRCGHPSYPSEHFEYTTRCLHGTKRS